MSFSSWIHIHVKLQKPIKEGGECNLEPKCSIDWHTPKLFERFNVSPKMKTTKEEGIRVRSLTCSTSRVRGAC